MHYCILNNNNSCKMIKTITLITIFLCFGLTSFAQQKQVVKKQTIVSKKMTSSAKPAPKKTISKAIVPKKSGNYFIRIITDSGSIVVRLYDSTPLHRDNFVKLVKAGFYDSLLFHRVVPQFMIQGGDPTSKNAEDGAILGGGGSNTERIPAEFVPAYIHKKGSLAAARDNNPEKKSSSSQFYLVSGKKYSLAELADIEKSRSILFSEAEKNYYVLHGGTPFLDKSYTVFGETISGLEVIDKIAGMSRDARNRPLSNIRMKIELLK